MTQKTLVEWVEEQCSATPKARRAEQEADLYLSMVLGEHT